MQRGSGFLRKLHFFLLCLVCAFPLLPFKLIPLIITLWCVSTLFCWRIPPLSDRKNYIMLLLFILPFLMHAACLLASPSDPEIQFLTERKMGLFFIPLCIFFIRNEITSQRLHILFHVFIFSLLLEMIRSNIVILQYHSDIFSLVNNEFSYAYRTLLEQITAIHPTYFGMLLFFAAFLDFHMMMQELGTGKRRWLLLRITVLGLLILSAVLTGGRSPLAAFMAASFLYLIFEWGFGKKMLVSTLILASVTFAALYFTPTLKNRVQEISDFSGEAPVDNEQNTLNIRTGIYSCSWELVRQNWLTGTGPSNVQRSLNQCYSKLNSNVFSQRHYNTHNELLNHWISFGIAGLLALLAVFFIPGYFAVKEKNIIYLCFLLFFFICCMTENLLSRQMGVVFYALFNALLAFAGKPAIPLKEQEPVHK